MEFRRVLFRSAARTGNYYWDALTGRSQGAHTGSRTIRPPATVVGQHRGGEQIDVVDAVGEPGVRADRPDPGVERRSAESVELGQDFHGDRQTIVVHCHLGSELHSRGVAGLAWGIAPVRAYEALPWALAPFRASSSVAPAPGLETVHTAPRAARSLPPRPDQRHGKT